MGGSPSGFMSARGAADFLTRATTVLATIFVTLSIALAVIAATRHRASAIDTSLVGKTAPVGPATGPAPGSEDALGGAASAAGNSASNNAVPLVR